MKSEECLRAENRAAFPVKYVTSICEKTLQIFRVAFSIMLVGLFTGIVLTVALHNSLYLIIAASSFVGLNLPFAIVLAVCLIKWIRREK